MIVHIFRYDCEGAECAVLPPGLRFHCWSPEDGLPPRGSRRISNFFWWALAKAGAFARDGFTELRIERGDQLLHRLIVTPRWYRFPFMGPDDLQIGDVWTSPAARRQELAQAAIGEVHRRFGSAGTKLWYVAESNNLVSAALARSCGYRLVAIGRRTRHFGTALFGRFVIDRYVERGSTDTQAIAPEVCPSAPGEMLSVSHCAMQPSGTAKAVAEVPPAIAG